MVLRAPSPKRETMTDPYSAITRTEEALQARLAGLLELRAADPQQRAIRQSYLAELQLSDARALEVGCGTGAISRTIAELSGIREVVGLDPSAIFLERARELARGYPQLSFQVGDA